MPKTKIPTTLKEAKKQRALLQEQLAVLRLSREKNLLEGFFSGSFYDWFGGSDLWDRIRPRSNDGDVGWTAIPPSYASDRRHGENWPIWRTQPDLDFLRQQARIRVETNAFAAGLLRNLTNNVIGKGYAYKAQLAKPQARPEKKNADGEPMEGPNDALVEATQQVIDAFLKRNRFNGEYEPQTKTICGTREREIYRTVVGDGECFVRFHAADDGVEIRILDASQIRDYNANPETGWSFGIRHRMIPYEDVETPEEYHVYWPDPSATGGTEGLPASSIGEFIPASEILHLKGPDTPSTVKRGIASRFIFDAGRALDRAAKLQENSSISAAVRAANAEIWQTPAPQQTNVDSMAGALATNIVTDPTTGSLRNVEKRYPGMVRRIPEGMEWVQVGAGQEDGYNLAKMGDLQQAAAGSCAPAFWLGDTENANYSNLESAAAPAVREGCTEQEYYKAAFAAIVWRAVLFAVERGELPEEVLTLVKIHVEATAVLHRNELEKAQEDKIAIETGWKDRQTACEERGGDWEVVKERNAQYTKDNPPPQPGGLSRESGVKPPLSEVSGRGPRNKVTKESVESRLAKLKESYGDTGAKRIVKEARHLLDSRARVEERE